MYVKSIKEVTNFTRPIRSIIRNYGSEEVIPGCATCIIINDEGWVLTCKHVMEVFRHADSINKKYQQFKNDVAGLAAMSASKKRRAISALEQKYGYTKTNPCTIQIKYSFDNIVDQSISFTVVECGYADLALIKFEGFNQVLCNTFPVDWGSRTLSLPISSITHRLMILNGPIQVRPSLHYSLWMVYLRDML